MGNGIVTASEASDAQPVKLTGSCLCGKVTGVAEFTTPKFNAICHCSRCRVWSGAPFSHAIAISSSEFTVSPESEGGIISHTHEDGKNTRTSCGTCGCSVWQTVPEHDLTILCSAFLWGKDDVRLPKEFKATAQLYYDDHMNDFDASIPRLSGGFGSDKYTESTEASAAAG